LQTFLLEATNDAAGIRLAYKAKIYEAARQVYLHTCWSTLGNMLTKIPLSYLLGYLLACLLYHGRSARDETADALQLL